MAKAGIDPNSLVTFDDYFKASDTIFEKTGIPGLVFATSAWFHEEFTAGLNLQYCTPDNGVGGNLATGLGYLNPQVYDLWKRIQQGYQKGSIVNAGSGGGAGAALLTSGNVAMQFNSSGNVTAVQKSKLPFTMRPFPRISDQAGAVPGGNSLWIMKEGKTPEEIEAAAAFARFIATPDFGARALPESGYLPPTQASAKINADDPKLPEQQKILLQNLIDTPATKVTAGCHIGAMSQIRTEVSNAIQKVAQGEDPKTAFEATRPTIQTAIERYQRRAADTKKN